MVRGGTENEVGKGARIVIKDSGDRSEDGDRVKDENRYRDGMGTGVLDGNGTRTGLGLGLKWVILGL